MIQNNIKAIMMAFPDLEWKQTDRPFGLVAYGSTDTEVNQLVFKHVLDRGLSVMKITDKAKAQKLLDSIDDWLYNGSMIQRAMPYMSPGDREMFMTGMPEKEFDDLFGEEDQDS